MLQLPRVTARLGWYGCAVRERGEEQISQHWRIRSLTPSSRSSARASMSSQKWRPQKSSSETAWWTAESQKPNAGSADEPVAEVCMLLLLLPCCSAPCSTSLRWLPRRQDATTILMKGSECRTLRTTHAGQPLVLHQSRSSATKHWSQEKAPRAAPRKASSRSTTDRVGVGDRAYLVCD